MSTPSSATSIDGVHLLTSVRHHDERGWFNRTLDLDWCAERGLPTHFPQHNQSRSHRGVLRGLHVRPGAGESKFVRCASGAVVDHVVDLRPWSPTFLQTERFELDDASMAQLYLPPFVAHGFQVVSDVADVCYLHSARFDGTADVSIAWDDPQLALDWPLGDPVLSERDAAAPRLATLDLDALFQRADAT